MTDQTAVWIDGDPLMEAIAADVWEQCEHHDSGLIVDDPRNIAAVAAAVARAHAASPAHATDRAALRDRIADVVRVFPFDDFGMDDVSYALEADPDTQEWVPKLADAVLAVLPAAVQQPKEA